MMKTKFRMLFGAMMVAVSIGFTACEGDQGEIGPKGDPGAKGDQGAQGPQGPKGDQGERGDKEATSFGNVELTISGVDGRGNAYEEVLDFKYLLDEHPQYSYYYENNDLNEKYFYIGREYKISGKTNAGGRDALSAMMLNVNLIEDELVLDYFGFSALFVSGSSYNQTGTDVDYDSDNVDDFVISNYSFNQETGELSFDFTFNYEQFAEPVELTGKVNVLVYGVPHF
jgi:Collagen triple helix repeat (20 copies).